MIMIKSFEELMRYTYPLTTESVVWDCGGFKGDFAAEISRRYNCQIRVFEPIPTFYARTASRLSGCANIQVYNYAIGGSSGKLLFQVDGDATGAYATSGHSVLVEKRGILDILQLEAGNVDLIKLNIEGLEFETLECLLDSGSAPRFRNIQVQFHRVIPDCEFRYQSIRDRLLQTHTLTLDYPWVWENYTLNPLDHA